MNEHATWMAISAVTGLSCFVIIHFTKLLKNPFYAAWLQLGANTFVFVSWGVAFLSTTGGFGKLFAFGGVVVPLIMASLTIRRVFRPKQSKGADE